MSLPPVDWFIIALYGALLFLIAGYLVKPAKTSEGYFLVGRSLHCPFIGASLFAANWLGLVLLPASALWCWMR
jgi:Na+/proline symporter